MENKTFREVKYPAIYKHFKNKYYATMGISHYISKEDFNIVLKERDLSIWNLKSVVTKFTENDKNIVCVNFEENWYHFDIYGKDIVLYKSLYDGTGIYARPIEMFLSKVDKEKYPNVKQEYRFEEIK